MNFDENIKLKNNSAVYCMVDDSRNVKIMLEDNRRVHQLKQVYEIKNFIFIDELELGSSSHNSLIVYGYKDYEYNDIILESFALDSQELTIYNHTQIDYCHNYSVYPIRKGIYWFEGVKNSYLCTAWGKKFDINRLSSIPHLTSLTFETIGNGDIICADLKFGDIETVRALLKLPTQPYEDFYISKNIYSFSSGQYYFFDNNPEDQFVYPSIFCDRLNETGIPDVVQEKQASLDKMKDDINKVLLKSLSTNTKKSRLC